MSFRNFVLCLSASFGVAWLAIIIVPYSKMRALEPVAMEEGEGASAVFIPKRAGRITDGAEVYAANGCYQCHSQLIRPTLVAPRDVSAFDEFFKFDDFKQ